MKEIIALILVLIAAIALASCATTVTPEQLAAVSTNPDFAPATTATPPATRPTVSVSTEPPMNGYQPDIFLAQVRSDIPYWYYNYTDDNLLDIALLACEQLDGGYQVDRLLFDLLLMVQEVDESLGDDLGYFLRYVVRYVCPEHFHQIENYSST